MPKMENSFKISSRRYLGSKYKLLPFISETIEKENIKFSSFFDIFAGTGIVSSAFNNAQTKIILNDLLECNRCSYNAFFGKESLDISKVSSLLRTYNSLDAQEDNYFSVNFSDTFFSRVNCRKIGKIRDDIDVKFSAGFLNGREKDYLITSLIYSMDRIANTVGHYDAFRRNGDLSKRLVLLPLEVFDTASNANNEIFKDDANDLARKISADLVYIDPPYNSRQYCDAYHLLENVAVWKKPTVYGVARKMDRANLKSRYCENSAPFAFDDLIQNLKCKYIIVSYNNMGLKGAGRSQAKVSDVDIIRSLERRGKVDVFEKEFNQFTTGKTIITDHKERLFVCKVGSFEKPAEIQIDTLVKSPLNYTGGKFKLLPQLIKRFPAEIDTFVDLFGGGFNVGVNVKSNSVVYNDISDETKRLIELLYKFTSSEIIDKLDNLTAIYGLSNSSEFGYEHYGCNSNNGLGSFNKAAFTKLRSDYNSAQRSVSKDFLLLLLIIFSFNNQMRFNSKGEFNLPVGKRDLNTLMRKNIIAFSEKIKSRNVRFLSKDFRKIDFSQFSSPFIYCDPPYLLGDASYNENGGWDEEKEIALLEYLKLVNAKGCKFALSNVIEHKGRTNDILLRWSTDNRFNLLYLNKNYSNSNYQSRAKLNVTTEVLVTNY